ncbi:MAG: nucleotidyltransferase domain-containing protein [Candidatus Moraniibacteriota bacterium]|nr:MAG: nucleotidyltransferase domain-containing protein [Candidatus Moranbacteria bacterium]
MTQSHIITTIQKEVKNSPYRKDIREVFLFGSYAYGSPKDESDIDLLFVFEPKSSISFFDLVEIQSKMEKNIGKKIDLLTPEALNENIKENILSKAQKIYG